MIRLEPRVSFPDNKDFLAKVKAFVSPMVFFKVNYIVYICWVRLDVKLDLYNILPRKVASAMDFLEFYSPPFVIFITVLFTVWQKKMSMIMMITTIEE